MSGQDLSERKKQILKAIVESHIELGEPVGSKSIQQLPGMRCSSATIRNEMAELEEMGYLEQPHTSAGRVPSQLGYRFYVDQLKEHYDMTTGEIAQINRILKNKTEELDQILLAASKIAAAMTNYTGLAVKPKRRLVTVDKFDTAYVDEYNFVLIMITSIGAIASRHIRLSEPRQRETVQTLCSALNQYAAGLTAEAINLPVIMNMESAMGADASLVSPIIKTVYAVLNEYDGGELQLSGINHLLQYSDYDDPDELVDLLGTLEQKDEILKIVSESDAEDVSVLIGSESSVRVMNNSTLVFKPIIRNGKTLGVIGLIGPLRMDYAKVFEIIDRLCGSVAQMMDDYTKLPPGKNTSSADPAGDNTTVKDKDNE
ncbi:MAG: heat-inducible transcriptional repressor HrcA [Clostridia bacterium]|nr:heat-inducible transcriptional repressor HrcA [Clostridia bacterium]